MCGSLSHLYLHSAERRRRPSIAYESAGACPGQTERETVEASHKHTTEEGLRSPSIALPQKGTEWLKVTGNHEHNCSASVDRGWCSRYEICAFCFVPVETKKFDKEINKLVARS